MKAARFVMTNVSGTLVETLVLLALSRVLHARAAIYVLAPLVAFELAVLNNYTLSYFWVFRERVQGTGRDYVRRFAAYNASAAAVFGGRLALVALLGFGLGLDVVVCNLVALSVSGLASFGAQDRLIFA